MCEVWLSRSSSTPTLPPLTELTNCLSLYRSLPLSVSLSLSGSVCLSLWVSPLAFYGYQECKNDARPSGPKQNRKMQKIISVFFLFTIAPRGRPLWWCLIVIVLIAVLVIPWCRQCKGSIRPSNNNISRTFCSSYFFNMFPQWKYF